MIEPVGKEINHILALPLNDNGKSLSLTISFVTSLHSNVLQISQKVTRWSEGSS